MNDKYYHIKFEEKGYDFTLKEAQIILDPKLNEYEFILENISNLNFNVDTIFRLTNNMLLIDYLCKVIESHNNSLVLKILEWAEW